MTSTPTRAQISTLGSAEQIAAEKLALRILALPATQEIWAEIRSRLRHDPGNASADGRALLDRALVLWTAGLAVRQSAGDTARPIVLWTVDTTPHEWHGHTFPGAAVGGDNPDNIYRTAFIDGTSRYEVRGRRPALSPVQFSIEITHSTPGEFTLKAQSSSSPDLGDQVAILSDRELRVEADGTFVVTLDQTPANGRPNHLQLQPGPLSVIFRDTRTDWNQAPYCVSIRSVDGPASGPKLSDEVIIRRTLTDMPDYLMFWASFKNAWLGAPKPNVLAGPVSRDGGWGFLAGGHFDLESDEALLARIDPAGAKYTSVQVTDPWFITNNSHEAFTSLNSAQVTADANGEVTYVISKHDPGTPNWISTSGLRHGMMVFRWQHAAHGTDRTQLVREFKRVKLADLKGLLPDGTHESSSAQRALSLARRAADYDRKLWL